MSVSGKKLANSNATPDEQIKGLEVLTNEVCQSYSLCVNDICLAKLLFVIHKFDVEGTILFIICFNIDLLGDESEC